MNCPFKETGNCEDIKIEIYKLMSDLVTKCSRLESENGKIQEELAVYRRLCADVFARVEYMLNINKEEATFIAALLKSGVENKEDLKVALNILKRKY